MKNLMKKILGIVLILAICITSVLGVNANSIAAIETTEEFEEEENFNGTVDTEDEDLDFEEEDFTDLDEETIMSADEDLEITFNITSEWEGHYNVEVTLFNISCEVIDDWEIHMDFKDRIENIWNAKLVDSIEGESVIIKHADWNQDILEEGTVSFGMTVSYDGDIEFPEECYLTRESVEVAEEKYKIQYIQHSKWAGHVNGQVVITNIGEERIEDWKLHFETTKSVRQIENIWNAKTLGIHDDTLCQVDNATYNQNIEPGQSVEFGFIAECDEEFEIQKTSLYQMSNVEYENGVNADEMIDEDSDNWIPDFDLDDFDTYEEYVEYLESNGYAMPVTFGMRTRASNELITPIVKKELTFSVPKNQNVNALQSFLWDNNQTTLFSIYRKKKKPNVAYLCETDKNASGDFVIRQGDGYAMKGFSHGQSLERFTVVQNDKKYKKYMFCGNTDNSEKGWARNVVLLNEKDVVGKQDLDKQLDYYKKKKSLKKIVGLKATFGDKRYKTKRLDAAISSNGKVLAVWCEPKNSDKKQIALYDMSVIKEYLYNEGHYSYSMNNKKLRNAALITMATGAGSLLKPNASFQSIEVSNAFGKSKNKWKVYITSGNTGKGQRLTVTSITITKSGTIEGAHRAEVEIPYNKQGQPILHESSEVEGCHIKGDELQFILTNSEDKLEKIKPDKAVQYIVSVKKSILNAEKYEIAI